MTSRRGFLGGCIAILSTNIIMPAGAAHAPRSWVRLAKQFMHGIDVNGWCGIRNDGVMFFAQNGLSSLNEFLDSSCDCTLGHFCQKHEHLDGGPYKAPLLREPTGSEKMMDDRYAATRRAQLAVDQEYFARVVLR